MTKKSCVQIKGYAVQEQLRCQKMLLAHIDHTVQPFSQLSEHMPTVSNLCLFIYCKQETEIYKHMSWCKYKITPTHMSNTCEHATLQIKLKLLVALQLLQNYNVPT